MASQKMKSNVFIMTYNLSKDHRQTTRLKGYDYSTPVVYFVTICTYERSHLFGEIENSKIKLLPIGKIAVEYWQQIPNHFPDVKLDEFIVMPNHIHGIIHIISNPTRRGVQLNALDDKNKNDLDSKKGVKFYAPTSSRFSNISPKKNTLGSIIRSYKTAVTSWCNQNNFGYFSWQRNYFDHIIRNDEELYQIREYIITNPQNWDKDTPNTIFNK